MLVQARRKIAMAAKPSTRTMRRAPRVSCSVAGDDLDARARIAVRVFLLEIDRHGVHLLLDLRDRRLVLQPSQHAQVGLAAIAVGAIDHEWLPEVGVIGGVAEAFRQHADDRSRSAIDDQRLSDRIAAGEAGPRVIVTEDDGRRRAGLHVCFGEAAAARRRDAENIEHVRGHPRAVHLLRHRAANRGAGAGDRRQGREPLCLRPMIEEVQLAPRKFVAVLFRICRPRKDHSIEIARLRQRIEEHPVDQAEHRGGGSKGERQRRDRRDA